MITKQLDYEDFTPLQIYQALGGKGACLIEQEEGALKTSSIGIDPIGTFSAHGYKVEVALQGQKNFFSADPYETLKEFSKNRQVFGFISYGAIRVKEAIPDRHADLPFPDFFFHLYQTVFTFDHCEKKLVCTHEGTQESLDVILKRCSAPASVLPFAHPKKLAITSDLSKEKFVQMVEKAKKHIRAGDVFQVVLSRTFHAQAHASPFDIYRALLHVSPAPYHFFFEEEEFAIAGASPELLISVKDRRIETVPIAGTYPKGQSASTLLESPKETAEHVMLVDLARNDIGAIAKVGSVRVEDYISVKSFSHVSHIVSRVTGMLDSSFHALDAFKASFPAGTLSGAPKIRAMEIIDALENSRRGLYGGAIVSIDEQGNLTSCIAIRTAFIRGKQVEVRTGAGIVLDSDPEKEAEETEHKARGVLEALELAEGSYDFTH